ncbi:MAG: hypothetical protein ABI193_23715 [Minicystis sp.]
MAAFVLQASDGQIVAAIGGSISLPMLGAWTARIETGEDASLTGALTLLVAPGDGDPVAFVGIVDHAEGGAYEGRAPLVLKGGAGGLAGLTEAVSYTSAPTPPTVADLVSDLVSAAGERLAEGAYEALGDIALSQWLRASGEPWQRALSRLAAHLGHSWRVLDDSSVWFGAETWTEAELDGRLLDDDTMARILHVGVDRATARPGTTVLGYRISRVVFFENGRGELHYEAP